MYEKGKADCLSVSEIPVSYCDFTQLPTFPRWVARSYSVYMTHYNHLCNLVKNYVVSGHPRRADAQTGASAQDSPYGEK